MPTKTNSRSRNLSISLSTLAIVALLMGGYYFIYVEQNEDALHARNFRVLTQVNRNIQGKDGTYKQVAKNLPRDLKRFKEKVKNYYNTQVEAHNEAELIKYARLNRKNLEEFAKDSLKKDIQAIKASSDFDELEYLNDSLIPLLTTHRREFPDQPVPRRTIRSTKDIKAEDGFFKILKGGDAASEVPFHQVEKSLSEELKMTATIHSIKGGEIETGKYERFFKAPNGQGYHLLYAESPLTDEKDKAKYEIDLSKDLKEFMANIIRPDVYDDLLLFKVDKEVNGGRRNADVVFQTSSVPMRVNSLPDTLLLADKDFGLLANSLRRIRVVGTEYHCYLQPMQLDDQDIILCGLLRVERFNGEKFRVSTLWILVLVLILFIGLLILPVLRLRLLSYYERLGTSDVVLSMVTAILGSAAIVMMMFDAYRFNGPDATERKSQLVELSKDISHAFINELETINDQLMEYDNIANEIEGDVKEVASLKPGTNDHLHPDVYPNYYPAFTNVFWVGRDDKLSTELTTRKSLTEKVDVSGRDYLERVKSGDTWQLPGGDEIMLQSILTRTTGDNLAVVSRESKREDASIIFLATKLYSVVGAVLPYSFGFCIIDETGKVWFHSDPTKNLQENFLEECTAKPLSASIYARSSLYMQGNYEGKTHNLFIEPIQNLPLYIVTFEDKDFYRNTHEQILTFAFVLIMISFLFGIAIVTLMAAFSPRRRRLRGESFLFRWLRPHKGNATAYRVLLLANLVTLLVLYLFSADQKALEVINMFGLAYIYTFMMAYFSLRRKPSPTEPQIGVKKQYRFFTSAIILLIALNLITFNLSTHKEFINTIIFQLIHIAIGTGAMMLIYRLSPVDEEDSETYKEMLWKPFRWVVNRLTPRRSYRLFLLSWLAIISIYPSIKYYSIAYSREVKLEIKHTQVQLYKDIAGRSTWIDSQFKGLNFEQRDIADLKLMAVYCPPYFSTVHNGNNSSGVWKGDYLDPGEIKEPGRNELYSLYDSLFSRIRPRYDEKVRITNQLRLSKNADFSWFWQEGEGVLSDPSKGKVKTLTYQNRLDGTLLTSHLHEYSLPSPDNTAGVLFWLLFLGLLGFIYYLLDFTIRRLFAENVLEMKSPNDDEVRQSIKQTGQNVFMIIPPRAMGSKYKQTLGKRMRISFRDFHNEASFWENVEKTETKLGLIGEKADSQKKPYKREENPVVFNHFEFKLSDMALCQMKLKMIHLAMDTFKQVFIVSSIDPFELIVTYQQQIMNTKGDERPRMEDELESWTRTLSRFYKLNFPFESDPLPYGNSSHEALIAEECRHGAFLRYLYPELLNLYKGKKDIDPEDIILDIELRAQFYYQVLWSASTREEQYILYDLAQDGLVNGRNIRALKTLIRKGLLVNDGEELKIMNRSFRNYILTVTKPEHTLEMEERVNVESTWRRVRTPIMIILFTLAGFLFITQEELVSNTTAFVTAAAAGLPAIYRAIELVTGFNLGRILTRGGKKES